MNAEITPVKPEEAQELSELRRRVWLTTYRGIFPDHMIDQFDHTFHNERDRMRIESDQYAVYFIMEGTEKIGYLILQLKDPLRLMSLYILKEHQHKGIGSHIFAFVRGYCRDRAIARFTLDCHPDNSGALAFYAKMGGVITQRDEGHEHNEENGVRLEFVV